MNRLVARVAVAALLCCAFALAGCKGCDASLDNVLSKGTFVVGIDDSFAPMSFRNDDNEIVGFDVDLASEVAKRLGVELVLQPIGWNAKEMELNSKRIDCIWSGLTITAERAKAMLFSKPYLHSAHVAVVLSDSPYQQLTDLAGKTVGFQASTAVQNTLDQTTVFKSLLADIVEFDNNSIALSSLEDGGIDAAVLDIAMAEYSIHRLKMDFRILAELAAESYGLGFRKGDVALRDRVQAILEEMADEGSVAAISEKWFGADISIIGK